MANIKNWIGNKYSIYVTLGASDHTDEERAKQDYYATDPTAIDDLLKVELLNRKIWEPACGEGHLSKRLEHFGYDVYSTDIIDRGFGDDFFDFLESDINWKGDIVTNPPYKYAKEFVFKALGSIKEGHKVAMFLKLTFLEGIERQKLFSQHPPKRIWVYSFRKGVAKNGDPEQFRKISSAVCYAWFIWKKGWKGDPKIGWITRSGYLSFSGDLNNKELKLL